MLKPKKDFSRMRNHNGTKYSEASSTMHSHTRDRPDYSHIQRNYVRGMEKVAEKEAGKHDNEYGGDAGGPTSYGLSDHMFKIFKQTDKWKHRLPAKIQDVTSEQAKSVLTEEYYLRYKFPELAAFVQDDPIGRVIHDFVFDSTVQGNPKHAKKYIQNAINAVDTDQKIKVDGVFGKQTYDALRDMLDNNRKNARKTLRKAIELRRDYLKSREAPTGWKKNKNGWNNRLNAFITDIERVEK